MDVPNEPYISGHWYLLTAAKGYTTLARNIKGRLDIILLILLISGPYVYLRPERESILGYLLLSRLFQSDLFPSK